MENHPGLRPAQRDNGTKLLKKCTEELAEEFNVFFTSMGVGAAEAAAELSAEHNLPTLDPRALTDILESDQFRFYPITCYEIQKIVMSFSSNKAPGLDSLDVCH